MAEISDRIKDQSDYFKYKYILSGGLLLGFIAKFVVESYGKAELGEDDLDGRFSAVMRSHAAAFMLALACILDISIDAHVDADTNVIIQIGNWIDHYIEPYAWGDSVIVLSGLPKASRQRINLMSVMGFVLVHSAIFVAAICSHNIPGPFVQTCPFIPWADLPLGPGGVMCFYIIIAGGITLFDAIVCIPSWSEKGAVVGTCRVTFKVWTASDPMLRIVGSHLTMGQWSPERSISLTCRRNRREILVTGGFWHDCVVRVGCGSVLQYKIIKQTPDGMYWEDHEANRSFGASLKKPEQVCWITSVDFSRRIACG